MAEFNNFVFGYVLFGLTALEGLLMMITGKMFLGRFLILGWRNNYSEDAIAAFSRKAGFFIFLLGLGAGIITYVFDNTFIPWAIGAGFALFLIGMIGYIHCNRKYLKGHKE